MSAGSGPALSREEAIDALAACLYFGLERVDPSGHGLWEDLAEFEREFYREGIRELLKEKTLLEIAAGV